MAVLLEPTMSLAEGLTSPAESWICSGCGRSFGALELPAQQISELIAGLQATLSYCPECAEDKWRSGSAFEKADLPWFLAVVGMFMIAGLCFGLAGTFVAHGDIARENVAAECGIVMLLLSGLVSIVWAWKRHRQEPRRMPSIQPDNPWPR
jgi:hypothetical protein